MTKLSRTFVLLLLSSLATALFADNWSKIDWRKWSKQDCEKVLSASPWAATWGLGRSNLNPALPHVANRANAGISGEQQEMVVYYIQFLSASPVREALARQDAIQRKYDRMSPDQKKVFDEQLDEQYLKREFPGLVAIRVVYDSNIEPFERQLAIAWQSLPEQTIPEDTHLILADGRRIPPVRFFSPKGGKDEFELDFPRVVDGKPILSAQDKTLGLEFIHPGIQDFPRRRAFVEFSVPKMLIGNELVY